MPVYVFFHLLSDPIMILFQEDWDKYPTATVHHETSNRSWVQACMVLKQMGVKNHLFPLALLNEELKDVDPFDPNLTEEQKKLIISESQFNPWYFFREISRIPPQAGPLPHKVRLNRGNLALWWNFFNHVDIALVQIRQTGKSVSSDVLDIGLMYMFSTNTSMGLFTKDDSLRRGNIERLKKMREYLPRYIYSPSREDIDNTSEFSNSLLENHYRSAVAQKNEIGANNAGRGFTMPVQKYDETSFITLIDITMPAALSAANAAREEAAMFNRPYGNMYTTTAGRKDTRHGRYVHDFFHDAAPWKEIYYDAKDQEELYNLVVTNGRTRKVMVHAVYNHRQLGYTDEWLAQKVADANVKGAAANMDYFNIWESGSQSSPIDPEVATTMRESEMDPVYNQVCKEFYIISWYLEQNAIREFMSKNHCILGLDTSDAIGSDGLGWVLTDVRDMSTVAKMDINETNLYRFGKFLVWFLVTYKNVTLIIEKKSSAQPIIDTLLVLLPQHGEDPFKRIFNRIVDANEKDSQAYKEVVKTPASRRHPDTPTKYKKYFGFNTTGSSREMLYSNVLASYTKKAAGLVKDKGLINDLLGLVVRNNRIDHSLSGNDDAVIATLMSEWFVTNGQNLNFYGIDPLSVKTAEYKKLKEMPMDKQIEAHEQESIKAEINELFESLKNTHDVMQISRIESRLQRLTSKVLDDDSDYLSLDGMLKRAADVRKNNKIKQRFNRQY